MAATGFFPSATVACCSTSLSASESSSGVRSDMSLSQIVSLLSTDVGDDERCVGEPDLGERPRRGAFEIDAANGISGEDGVDDGGGVGRADEDSSALIVVGVLAEEESGVLLDDALGR